MISLLFNTVPRFVIAFLPRSMHLLISWLQSPYAVTLEPPKINSAADSTVSPSICHGVTGPDAMVEDKATTFFSFLWSRGNFQSDTCVEKILSVGRGQRKEELPVHNMSCQPARNLPAGVRLD